jgi:hypothetical protein
MELICYEDTGSSRLKSRIRPALATREWMTNTHESFAYRCLPLNIANAHGWEILAPCAFDAIWNGAPNDLSGVYIQPAPGPQKNAPPVSIFGQGVLTFHIDGIFRTPPGWNLWVGGSPNFLKDGIAPLTGVVETDWSPFTFTMNWRFTRANHWVHFEPDEPICFIFPVKRGYLDEVTPKFMDLDEAPELKTAFQAWSNSRGEFLDRVQKDIPASPTLKWQKYYYRGTDIDGKSYVSDHMTKLRLQPFARQPGMERESEAAKAGEDDAAADTAAAPADTSDTSHEAPAKPRRAKQVVMATAVTHERPVRTSDMSGCPVHAGAPRSNPEAEQPAAAEQKSVQAPARDMPAQAAAAEQESAQAPAKAVPAQQPAAQPAPERPADPQKTAAALRRRDWLLDVMETQRQLAPSARQIERRIGLTTEEFLNNYYAQHRPVILCGEMSDWPALSRWSPAYLREAIGSRVIEYQGGRTKNEVFEIRKDLHKREMPFDQYIDMISRNDGNDAYITAYNSDRNTEAVSVLHRDLGFLDKFLTRTAKRPHGMMWFGPAGTFTPLHHDLTNNFIAQIVGRKRFKLVAAADVGKVYNNYFVFSEVVDLEDPNLDLTRYPLLRNARIYDVTLCPGEILFVPIAWWHQVKALDFSVTITSTNFHWPNGAMYGAFPQD